MKSNIKTLLLSLTAIYLYGCEKVDIVADPFRNVPEFVKQKFIETNGNDVKVIETVIMDYQDVSIKYSGIDGSLHECMFSNGIWQYDIEYIAEKDLDNRLPFAVKKSFYRCLDTDGEIRLFPNWRDAFYMVSRRGVENDVFEFYFHTNEVEDGWLNTYVQISNDGTVLSYSHSEHNPSKLFYDHDDAISYIKEKYDGCLVKGYANDSGANVFFIQHHGFVKEVVFANNYQTLNDINLAWTKTVWSLGKDADIPSDIRGQVSDLSYSDVRFKEDNQGKYYGFQYSDSHLTNKIYWYNVK